MGQLEDFRASLKRKDSAVSIEGEIPVKNVSKAKQEKMKRRTLGVSGELHLELKALSVWRIKSHPKASPGITDTIQEMMRVYYKKYPEAKEIVEIPISSYGNMWDFIRTRFASKAPLSSAKFHVPIKRRRACI